MENRATFDSATSAPGMIFTLDAYGGWPANPRSAAVILALREAFAEMPEIFRPELVIFNDGEMIETAYRSIAPPRRSIAVFDGFGPGHFSLLPKSSSDRRNGIPAWARNPARAIRVHNPVLPTLDTRVRNCANQIRALAVREWCGLRPGDAVRLACPAKLQRVKAG